MTAGDPQGSSESVPDEPDAVLAFARHLGARLMTLQGDHTPNAELTIAMFNDADRAELVEGFVEAMTPQGVSPTIWLRWTNGGPGRFASGGLKKPAPLQHGVGKEVSRGPRFIAAMRDKGERCRLELEQADRELEHGLAFNKSLLPYVLSDHLMDQLSAIFAVDPGWTVLRSLSAHLPHEMAEDCSNLHVGDPKVAAIA